MSLFWALYCTYDAFDGFTFIPLSGTLDLRVETKLMKNPHTWDLIKRAPQES